MAKRSRQLSEAHTLRDLIADAILDYESRNKGYKVVLDLDYVPEGAKANVTGRAKLTQIAIDIVAVDGSHKTTGYRQMRSDT